MVEFQIPTVFLCWANWKGTKTDTKTWFTAPLKLSLRDAPSRPPPPATGLVFGLVFKGNLNTELDGI